MYKEDLNEGLSLVSLNGLEDDALDGVEEGRKLKKISRNWNDAWVRGDDLRSRYNYYPQAR
jgi:hypothetical protein